MERKSLQTLHPTTSSDMYVLVYPVPDPPTTQTVTWDILLPQLVVNRTLSVPKGQSLAIKNTGSKIFIVLDVYHSTGSMLATQ